MPWDENARRVVSAHTISLTLWTCLQPERAVAIIGIGLAVGRVQREREANARHAAPIEQPVAIQLRIDKFLRERVSAAA